jgi:acetyl esterase/lipase
MSAIPRILLPALLAVAAALIWSAGSATTSYTDLLARPRLQASVTRSYGPAPNQRAELFLPAGMGPHRVIVLIHGGCWLAQLPGAELMDYMAADLRNRGYAVWNIDYRRIGEDGGGYPGTFLDVAKALDSLRQIAPAYKLDLGNVVVVGHSAGGQLALWAAARSRLPRTSQLYQPNPLPIAAVVSLAGIDDLQSYRDKGPSACGGAQTIDSLVGPATALHRDVYADTSPSRLLPIGVKQLVVSGGEDPIVPAEFGIRYAHAAASAGDNVITSTISAAGHFELIDPQSSAWREIEPAIENLERTKPAAR